jgi:two-component system, cell cycle sensor histidine kinase and response regulator CckA
VSASTNPLDPAAISPPALNSLLSRVVTESTQALAICSGPELGERRIIYVNPEFEKLTGWTAAAARGRNLSVLLRPPGGQFEWERIEPQMLADKPIRRSLPAARRDGTVFWADLHLYPLSSSAGEPSPWVCMLSDVTEHLELHHALRLSETQHRLLAENIRDLITVCSTDQHCRYVSSSCRSMLGYEPEAMVGVPFGDFVDPQDRATLEQAFQEHFADRSESVLVVRLLRKDGSSFWAEMTSKTRRDSVTHAAVEIISTTRDITKRRTAEENLRAMHRLLDAVYDAVPIGLGLLDSRGHFLQCNRAFAELLGISSAEIAGRAADTLLPATDLARATVAQGTVCECECTRSDGGSVPAELSIVPISTGNAAQSLVVLSDLRERRKMEARLREASHLESLGTLAGGIAHDFNNMLAIVLGYASLLRDAASEPARITHYADTIIDAGKRGAEVVRQLQLFANTQDAELASTDLHSLLEETLERATAGWPRDIEVVKSFTAPDPTLTADPHQLTQAVQKLLENAREAMPQGGKLILRTSEVRQAHFSPGTTGSEEKRFLRVSVEDTGQGMDAATRARMFEPFFARNKSPETRGLGLAVVYGIMRAHRGLIEVDSAPGQGTTVHLLFPRATPKTEFTHTPFPESSDAAADRRTILLVEDEQDIGALWLEILPTDGWRVLWARDGGEALRLFRAHRDEIALVFTDIGLPVLDGWHVAETIRRDMPSMPLLIASGAFRSGDRQRGFAEPVAYLSKPYVPTKVIGQIRSLASKSKA